MLFKSFELSIWDMGWREFRADDGAPGAVADASWASARYEFLPMNSR